MVRKPIRALALTVVASMSLGLGALVPARAATTITSGTVTSFDGTPISYTLMLPASLNPVPVIFYTHGWGGSRATAPDPTAAPLLAAGYAVLTWDARGFGTSGGEANVDSQEYEVRDVQALIDLAASNPAIATDGPGDPRMGMVGGSYAGGIQLETAAADPRVDAIVPTIAWNDLPQSLKPNGVVKLGWDLALYGLGVATGSALGLPAGQIGSVAPQIHQALAEGVAINDWTQPTFQWFDAKSPKHYIDGATLPDGRVLPGLTVPTLIIQGTKDTLFPMAQGIANFNQIRARGVPSAMVWFCGGHTIAVVQTACVAGPGTTQSDRITAETLNWLDQYVKGSGSGALADGSVIYQSQDGSWNGPVSMPSSSITAFGPAPIDATLINTVAPTGGQGTAAYPDVTKRFRFEIPGLATRTIAGLPRVRLTGVTSTAPEAYAFFKLVDVAPNGNEVAVDDQVTPLKLSWAIPTRPQDVALDLNGVAWDVLPGHRILLELTSTSSDYASSRIPSVTTISTIEVTLPVL